MSGAIPLIAGKDLRQRLRDRSVLIFTIVLPLGLAVIFDLILGDLVSGANPFAIAVADADGGPVAAAFREEVLPAVRDTGGIEFHQVPDAAEAARLVSSGEMTAAIVLPAGFSADVTAGRAASLQVLADADAQLGADVARAVAGSFAAEAQWTRVAVTTIITGGSSRSPAEITGLAPAVTGGLRVVDDPATSRELDPTTFYAAGMAVFFLFFSVQFGVSSLLDERRDGTLVRLLAAPVRSSSVLAGKLVTSLVIGVVSTSVLVVASSLLIGARWGPPLGVALLVVSGVLAATGVMAIVAALARTAEQAGSWQAVIAIVLGALGGTFFPVAQIGGALATLSSFTPHHWFLAGLADLAGGGVVAVWPAVAALTTFAVVMLAAATLIFRRRIRS